MSKKETRSFVILDVALDKAASDYANGASIDYVAKKFNASLYGDCPLCGGIISVPVGALYSQRSVCGCDDKWPLHTM